MTVKELGHALLFEVPPEYRDRVVIQDFGNEMLAEVLGIKWGTGIRGRYVGMEMGPVRPQGIED